MGEGGNLVNEKQKIKLSLFMKYMHEYKLPTDSNMDCKCISK